MIGRILAWWRQRTPREQGLLILLALIAAPVLLGYGVVRPMDRALDRARLMRDSAARDLADTLLMAGRIRGADRPRHAATPIDAAVRNEAERAGFAVATLTGDGEGVMLTIDAVRPQPFFAWLAAVRQHGLIVTRLAARPNVDTTLSVSLRLRRAR